MHKNDRGEQNPSSFLITYITETARQKFMSKVPFFLEVTFETLCVSCPGVYVFPISGLHANISLLYHVMHINILLAHMFNKRLPTRKQRTEKNKSKSDQSTIDNYPCN